MNFEDYVMCLMDGFEWRIRRTKCFLLGCQILHWSENEWIHGTDCKRCDAGYDNTGNETPHKFIEGNIVYRLFPIFWLNHFG
mgnify:CR=1 FL=1